MNLAKCAHPVAYGIGSKIPIQLHPSHRRVGMFLIVVCVCASLYVFASVCDFLRQFDFLFLLSFLLSFCVCVLSGVGVVVVVVGMHNCFVCLIVDLIILLILA